jgi:dephospho-CoA kinase
MNHLLSEMKNCNAQFVFAEVPLLFEGNFEKQFDFVIVVQRDINQRISAIKNRDNLSETEIYNRIQSQIDYTSIETQKYFKESSFFIIENNSNVEALKKQLQKILETLKKHQP